MAFNRYLNFLIEYSGTKVDRPRANQAAGDGLMDSAIAGMFDRHDAKKYREAMNRREEAKVAIQALNEYFVAVMLQKDRTLPIPQEVLTVFAHKELLNFEKLTKQYLSILTDVRFADRGFPFQDLRAAGYYGGADDAFAQVVNLLAPLHALVDVLAREPIMVDTGQYRPKMGPPRTYADMENEIASRLTNLPNYHAKVKTLTGEYTIETLPMGSGITGQALTDRRETVQEYTRSTYCRARNGVEEEISERQAALQQEEERIQGRREEIEPGQPDGQTPFRPSRRHKEPPKN